MTMNRFNTKLWPFPWNDAATVIDASKIKDFLSCPRMFFYRHVLGWEVDRPNNHLAFGSAWHEAMEHLLLNGYDDNSIMTAFDKFLACYREQFPEETDELFAPKTPMNALRALQAYAEAWHNDDFKTLHTEIGGQISIDGKRSLAFRMDSVCEHPDGSLFSLEHKTKGGAFTRVWIDQWPLSIQVGGYSHVLACLALDKPVRGVVINGAAFIKKRELCDFAFERVPVYRSPEHTQNWLFHINHYFDQIEMELDQLWNNCKPSDTIMTAFPMNPESCTKYFGCQFFDFCNAWNNPLARCEEPPIGYVIRHWNPLDRPVKTEMNV